LQLDEAFKPDEDIDVFGEHCCLNSMQIHTTYLRRPRVQSFRPLCLRISDEAQRRANIYLTGFGRSDAMLLALTITLTIPELPGNDGIVFRGEDTVDIRSTIERRWDVPLTEPLLSMDRSSGLGLDFYKTSGLNSNFWTFVWAPNMQWMKSYRYLLVEEVIISSLALAWSEDQQNDRILTWRQGLSLDWRTVSSLRATLSSTTSELLLPEGRVTVATFLSNVIGQYVVVCPRYVHAPDHELPHLLPIITFQHIL